MANNNDNLYNRPLDGVFSNEELVGDCKELRGRVASDGKTQHWPGKDRRGFPDVLHVDNFVEPLRGMFNMQVARDKPMTLWSMREALQWERNAHQLLRHVTITDNAVVADFFGPSAAFDIAMNTIRKPPNQPYHRFFRQVREARFWVLLFGLENNSAWGAVIIYLRPFENGDIFAKRINIILPLPVERAETDTKIRRRLCRTLREGAIMVPPNPIWDTLAVPDIPQPDNRRLSEGMLKMKLLSEGYQPKVSSIVKNALKAKVKSKLSQGAKKSPVPAAQLKEGMAYRMAMGEIELLTLSDPGERAALISPK